MKVSLLSNLVSKLKCRFQICTTTVSAERLQLLGEEDSQTHYHVLHFSKLKLVPSKWAIEHGLEPYML